MIRLISWNVAGRDLWDDIGRLNADVALLQEVRPPPQHSELQVVPAVAASWGTAGWERRAWRTAIARLSDRVMLASLPTSTIETASSQADWTISREGTVTAADVRVGDRALFTGVSVYAPWERTQNNVLYADASAHRILSDLSALIPSRGHRLIVAGDWNILFGYGEHGDLFFQRRYETVFSRAEALGLEFVGPQFPNGRQADPWPDELPEDSLCVPTYYHSRQSPATATRQLDFVFASKLIADSVNVRAVNEVSEWGPSDHCRIVVEVDLS